MHSDSLRVNRTASDITIMFSLGFAKKITKDYATASGQSLVYHAEHISTDDFADIIVGEATLNKTDRE